jgi:hypothetical protein
MSADRVRKSKSILHDHDDGLNPYGGHTADGSHRSCAVVSTAGLGYYPVPMVWFKLTLLLLALFLVALLIRSFRSTRHFRRKFDDSSAEAGERLRQHVQAKDSTRERRG